MLIVGLTGGIACGKTTVAQMLVDKGAILLDADIIAREITRPGKPAWHEIVLWLGDRVLKEDRSLDRVQIAALVFSDQSALMRLNAITHPRIIEHFGVKSRELAMGFPDAIQIWDIPLLFEINMHREVDLVLVAAADKGIQINRLKVRDGLLPEEALRRIESQMDMQEKIRRADYVVYNNSTIAFLQEQVDQVWDQLLKTMGNIKNN